MKQIRLHYYYPLVFFSGLLSFTKIEAFTIGAIQCTCSPQKFSAISTPKKIICSQRNGWRQPENEIVDNNNNNNNNYKSSNEQITTATTITTTTVTNEEMLALEREVMAKTQAELDLSTLKNALLSSSTAAAATTEEKEKSIRQKQEQSAPSKLASHQWSIASAASLSSGFIIFLVTNSIVMGILISVVTGLVAIRNPLDEVDPAGAVARTMGRYTIATAEAATPRARAMARAVLLGEEEITNLKAQLDIIEAQKMDLMEENSRLQIWKKQRLWVDDNLSSYNLQDLKTLARENKLQVGGTKSQLLMRLVEAELINIDL